RLAISPGLGVRRLLGDPGMPRNLTERLVRNKLAKYLANELSLRAFTKWFVPASWDMAPEAPPQLKTLVYEIDPLLAEYTSGYRTEDELREQFRPILGSIELFVGGGSRQPELRTASA